MGQTRPQRRGSKVWVAPRMGRQVIQAYAATYPNCPGDPGCVFNVFPCIDFGDLCPPPANQCSAAATCIDL